MIELILLKLLIIENQSHLKNVPLVIICILKIKDLSFSHLCNNCHDALMMSINLNSIQLLSTLFIIVLSTELAEVNPRIY